MSSYMVGDGVIDLTVLMLAGEKKWTPPETGLATLDKARAAQPCDDEHDELMTALGKDLYLLNAIAVAHRYREEEDVETARLYEWHDLTPCVSQFQVLKAAQCLRYQCAEGAVPTKPLFKQLDRAIGELAETICRDLPQYEAAERDYSRPASVPIRLNSRCSLMRA